MGCVSSQEVVDDREFQNAMVERDLLQQQVQDLYNFKILLLGSGESGKSTIVKQLCLLHNKKQSKQELITIGDSLHQNVIDCMRALFEACERFGYDLDDETDYKTKALLQDWSDGKRLDPEIGELVQRLYNSNAVKRAYARRSEFWLLDSCNYYMKNLDRFCNPDFVPTEEDCVMARIRTTGIVESDLEQKFNNSIEGEPDTIKFKVVDVGGQRNERKKWMHCFDDVKAILFIVSLAGYNQVLFEDNTKIRLTEDLELFKDITSRKNFQNTPIFLFLNKKDLFETMIKEASLSHLFPEYDGPSDVQPAIEFIQEQFRAQLPPGKSASIHVVTGVYRRDIKDAFKQVKDDLIEANKDRMKKLTVELKKQQTQVDKTIKKGGKQ